MSRLLMLVAIGLLFVTLIGCGDPQKPAGPGGARMQNYDGGNGQYKP